MVSVWNGSKKTGKIKVTVKYWVEDYSEITGWTQGEVVNITENKLIELSSMFDVALMYYKHIDTTCLCIDEQNKHFCQR